MNCWVNFAVYDQHRTGLRRELRCWLLGQKTLGDEDGGVFGAEIENAVRLEMEVAGSVRRVGASCRPRCRGLVGDRSGSYMPAFIANAIGAPFKLRGKRSKPP
jgi:hypothetical protein